jgi:chaperonin GroES
MTDFQPRGNHYLVRMVKPAEKTERGIYLPEVAQQNQTEAEVLACGPGLRVDGDDFSEMYALPGDRVVFKKQDFTPLGDGEGVVRDDDLLGIVGADGYLEPLNDWVMLTAPEREERLSEMLVLPEAYQRWAPSGKIVDYGPGRLVLRATVYFGTRLSVPAILGVPSTKIVGRWARWDPRAAVVDVWGKGAWRLVRAGDLIALETA